MKFSAQEEYGLRCLLALARLGEGASITIPQISQKEHLTVSHVAKLMAILRSAGLVKATRGQQGGYQMARKPEQIKVKEILEPLGGRLYDEDEFCDRFQGADCTRANGCELKPLWRAIQRAVDLVVDCTTLEDLMQNRVADPTVQMMKPNPC